MRKEASFFPQTFPGAAVKELGLGAAEDGENSEKGRGPKRRRHRGGVGYQMDSQPLGGSPQVPSSPSDTSAPTTAWLAVRREWGGGSKIREKQFDVSNKASLHFAKLILTPIIICCRSGRVLPTAA